MVSTGVTSSGSAMHAPLLIALNAAPLTLVMLVFLESFFNLITLSVLTSSLTALFLSISKKRDSPLTKTVITTVENVSLINSLIWNKDNA